MLADLNFYKFLLNEFQINLIKMLKGSFYTAHSFLFFDTKETDIW